jgi:hypothetical protein
MKDKRLFQQIVSVTFVTVCFIVGSATYTHATEVASTPTPMPTVTPTPTPIPSKVVTKIVLGTNYASSEDKTKNCMIVDPLPEPREYPTGTKVFAFQIDINPTAGKVTGIEYTGMDIATTRTRVENCTTYAIIQGNPELDRIAVTFQRTDGEPWKTGSYKLVISVSNEPTIEIPFVVK